MFHMETVWRHKTPSFKYIVCFALQFTRLRQPDSPKCSHASNRVCQDPSLSSVFYLTTVVLATSNARLTSGAAGTILINYPTGFKPPGEKCSLYSRAPRGQNSQVNSQANTTTDINSKTYCWPNQRKPEANCKQSSGFHGHYG